MPDQPRPQRGLYEQVLDEQLDELLSDHPDVAYTLATIDDESAPHTYAQFVSQLIESALRITHRDKRLPLLNRLIELLSSTDGLDYLKRRKLVDRPKNLLTDIELSETEHGRPVTPLSISALLTGVGGDPQLEHELRMEMSTSDSVNILISFIKWSGLRLLIPAFKKLQDRDVPVRIITTSYMGASDPEALGWLAEQSNVRIRVSYDTSRTRLHAKAYHFERRSGFSTAYIGSANMSHAAMTSGLEWTVKVTAQDMPHILQRFSAEFSTYWNSHEFEPFDTSQLPRFQAAIQQSRSNGTTGGQRFFADITPHPYQERILDALEGARIGGSCRNLVVAATGTGKTVISALDYARHARREPENSRLLFVVHRKEILQQARECFQAVLHDANFGELLVDGEVPLEWNHVFASIQSLIRQQPWKKLGHSHFDFVVIDEAHHGTARSYRPIAENLNPQILLGLTATPERMDATSILPDFDNRFAAEIRLPEALEEKLLCPFHYFGVTDPVSLADERFWRNGKFDTEALTDVYTGDDLRAKQRVDTVLKAIHHYQPNLQGVRCLGFCATVRHARYMADKFREAGHNAVCVLGDTPAAERAKRIRDFRKGTVTFIFSVDVFSEGIDIPEINMVLFLRPTESLTVFLQQLGRGLRHAPEKECLTVLDFVGQTHRRYRVDQKFAALLTRNRLRLDHEVEADFPNLPSGCNIQLERIARQTILEKIQQTLGNLRSFVPEAIRTFHSETGLPLTFGNFVDALDLPPPTLLKSRTWSEWKSLAAGTSAPVDPNLREARAALTRLSLRTDPSYLGAVRRVCQSRAADEPASYNMSARTATALHYLLWGKKGEKVGVTSHRESFERWLANSSSAKDAIEIIDWRLKTQSFPTQSVNLPFPCSLRLHAAYGSSEIKAALALADLNRSGPAGTGVLHDSKNRVYVHLVTFRKDEKDFSPTTLYRDYPVSRTRLHWESQAATTQASSTGKNYLNFQERSYTILFFARLEKRINEVTAPFLFLGPAKKLVHYEGNRPIEMDWELEYPMPAEMFELARI